MGNKYFVSNFEGGKKLNLGQVKRGLLFLVTVLILIIGGFFLWQNRTTPPDKWALAEMSLNADYVISETSEVKLVKNKETGLNFEIPKDWLIEAENRLYTPYIAFLSPDLEKSEDDYLIKRGCRVVVSVSYIKTDLDTLERVLKENWPTPELNEFGSIEINNQTGIKHIFLDEENLKIYGIGIHISKKDKVYEIALEAGLADMEFCEGKFYELLETVSIK